MDDKTRQRTILYLELLERSVGLDPRQIDLYDILTSDRSDKEIDSILSVKSDLRFIINSAISNRRHKN